MSSARRVADLMVTKMARPLVVRLRVLLPPPLRLLSLPSLTPLPVKMAAFCPNWMVQTSVALRLTSSAGRPESSMRRLSDLSVLTRTSRPQSLRAESRHLSSSSWRAALSCT